MFSAIPQVCRRFTKTFELIYRLRIFSFDKWFLLAIKRLLNTNSTGVEFVIKTKRTLTKNDGLPRFENLKAFVQIVSTRGTRRVVNNDYTNELKRRDNTRFMHSSYKMYHCLAIGIIFVELFTQSNGLR